MTRPSIKLLLGILVICAMAAVVAGCAEDRHEWFGGIGFDLAGAAIQGMVGN